MINVFKRINVLPQWAIFFLDLIVVIIGLFLSFLIRNEFSFNLINKVIFLKNVVVLIAVALPAFIVLRTYTCDIRYATIQDAFRTFLAAAFINIGFILVYLVASVFYSKSFISITTLAINGVIDFVLLTLYRLVVKYLFAYSKSLNIERKNVIIYGTGEEGMVTKHIFNLEPRAHYRVIAFVDDAAGGIKKLIDGVPVFHLSDLPDVLQEQKVDDFVIAVPGPSVEKKIYILDACLDTGVQVLLTPPVNQWDGGRLSFSQIKKIKIAELFEREPVRPNHELIRKQLQSKRILVTGAGGSLGFELVNQIARFEPAMVILVDISETALYESELALRERYPTASFYSVIADARDYERMDSVFEEFKPDCVFHSAASKHISLMETHPAEGIGNNVFGTKNMVDLAVKHNAAKFVMMSTDKAANPINLMSATKRLAEIYVQSASMFNRRNDNGKTTGCIIVRFGNILGSKGSVTERFASQIRDRRPVTITDPQIERSFINVIEVCQLILEATGMGSGGEIFVVEMGKKVKIIDLARKMIRLSGHIPGIDISIEFTGLRPGEKLHEELPYTAENTRPTNHDRLVIAKGVEYNYGSLMENMDQLEEMIKKAGTEIEIIRLLKKMVPGYLSNH